MKTIAVVRIGYCAAFRRFILIFSCPGVCPGAFVNSEDYLHHLKWVWGSGRIVLLDQ